MPLLSDIESSVGGVKPLPCLPMWRWRSRNEAARTGPNGAVRDEDVFVVGDRLVPNGKNPWEGVPVLLSVTLIWVNSLAGHTLIFVERFYSKFRLTVLERSGFQK